MATDSAILAPTIPGYGFLEKIGEGGMGAVYRAVQLSLQRIVAIKVLNPFYNNQLLERAFQGESHLMASVSHPNVVTVFDCGKVERCYYLVLEYISGTTLRSHMKPGQPWPLDRAAPVLEAIARALSYIHSKSILHLDLKPENVLCGQRGEIKITDFGLALSDVGARTLSDFGVTQGTLDYCSPEQRYGLPIDGRSDLFSLATLAYELLTGRVPGRVYVPASQFNPRLSSEVDNVLRQGLARDPDERPATVEDFRRALMATVHVSQRSASRLGPLLAGLGAGLLLLLSLAGVLSLLGYL